MIFAGGQYAEADAPHDHYTRLKQLRLPVVLVNAAADNLDFPRVSNPPVHERLLSSPVPSRSAQQAQLSCLRLGHGKLDRTQASHLELQAVCRSGPRRAERHWLARAGEENGKAIAGRVGHRPGKSTKSVAIGSTVSASASRTWPVMLLRVNSGV